MSEAYDYTEEEQPEAPATQLDVEWLRNAPSSPNLAFDIDDTVLNRMGQKVCEEFEVDVTSREAAGYEEKIKSAVELAVMAKTAKNTPWDNASNVKYPLIIQAAIQFNARSYAALVDGPSLVKGRVLGSDRGVPAGPPGPDGQVQWQVEPGAKADRAKRISQHMSWQLLEEQDEWEEDTDALLLRLSIVGTLVRKSYFDPTLGHNCSHVIDPDCFVVEYKSKRDLSRVPRQTQVLTFYPHEIIERRRAGLWLDVDLGQPADAANDDLAPHTFLEQHRLWDLDEDGYPEPYVITVHKESQKVVRVVARWYPEGVKANERGEVVSIKPYECFTKYGFIPNPDGSFYDIGFGTLLGSTSDTINTILNQLLDAATLSNLQSGFIGEGVSIKSGNLRFKPGEWKKAGSSGGALRENIVPLPTKEPSSVLFSLLQFLISTSKELTSTQDILTGETSSATMPVGTTLALIEQGLKAYTAIVKRLHRSLKRELKINFELNARYLDEEVYFQFQDAEVAVARQDYQSGDMDVVPVSDPTMATDMQKMGRAQFLLGLRGSGLDDMEINKRALEAASVPDPDALMPKGPPPEDPKLTIEREKLKLEQRRLELDEAKAKPEIEKTIAETAQTQLETFMAGPEMAAMLEQAARQGAAMALEMMNGGQPAQVRPQELPGMEGPPVDGPPAPVPPGPAGGFEGAMGPGGGGGPPAPDQGPPDGGAFGPGVG